VQIVRREKKEKKSIKQSLPRLRGERKTGEIKLCRVCRARTHPLKKKKQDGQREVRSFLTGRTKKKINFEAGKALLPGLGAEEKKRRQRGNTTARKKPQSSTNRGGGGAGFVDAARTSRERKEKKKMGKRIPPIAKKRKTSAGRTAETVTGKTLSPNTRWVRTEAKEECQAQG